jgi:hypothetical protein
MGTYLMRIVAFDSCDEYMLEPAHATSDSKLVLHERVVEHLPASTVDAIMCKTSLPGYCNISSIVRYDSTSDRPLIHQVVWWDLDMMPKGYFCGYGCKIR